LRTNSDTNINELKAANKLSTVNAMRKEYIKKPSIMQSKESKSTATYLMEVLTPLNET
jgi:hypothetical protein